MKEAERLYALTCCADGRWLLLNRDYKPFGVGASRRSWFDYDTCPGIRVFLTAERIHQIEGGRFPYRTGDGLLWLYYDPTNPRRSARHRRAYQQRIAILGLKEEAVA